MRIKSILAAFVVMACGSLSAQNATKAELNNLTNQVNALSQKVAQLETNLERVITENVNLVEQLNVKTVTSVTDANGIQWDIVKVVPNANTNDVVISLRITNNSGAIKKITTSNTEWVIYDTNSNLSNNSYKCWDRIDLKLENGIPINVPITIKNVPVTCSYLSLISGTYQMSTAIFDSFTFKFTGVHIPW